MQQRIRSRFSFSPDLTAYLSRGLPENTRLKMTLVWPLWLLPIYVISQLLTPHPVWISLLTVTTLIYLLGYVWLRSQAGLFRLERTRKGAILVAGDSFEEEFTFHNHSRLPVLWAELDDQSDLPGYVGSRIAAVGPQTFTRWRSKIECRQRGLFRIGPTTLRLADPFSLFGLETRFAETETVLIYPRVARLPQLTLPRGNTSGTDRRRTSLFGVQPSASVREYQTGDSLRHIHWPTSAHRGALAVKELELEPSGDVWIVLDLNAQVQRGRPPHGTLDFAVMVAASLAAQLLDEGVSRAVGLLAVSGQDGAEPITIELAPQQGRAQLWRIMAALAPVQASDVPLAQLLHQSRGVLGRRRSLVVITPDAMANSDAAGGSAGDEHPVVDAQPPSTDWVAELLHNQSRGLAASALLIASDDADTAAAEAIRLLLSRIDVPALVMSAATELPPLITYRRTRTVLRSTPTGGVVVQEVEEEVG